jgi:hypothetical protein
MVYTDYQRVDNPAIREKFESLGRPLDQNLA